MVYDTYVNFPAFSSLCSKVTAFCPKFELIWDFPRSRKRKRVGAWHQAHTPGPDRGLRGWSQLRGWLEQLTGVSGDPHVSWVTWWLYGVLGKTSVVLPARRWIPGAGESCDCTAHEDEGQVSSSQEGSFNTCESHTYFSVCRLPCRKAYFFPKCGNRSSSVLVTGKIF